MINVQILDYSALSTFSAQKGYCFLFTTTVAIELVLTLILIVSRTITHKIMIARFYFLCLSLHALQPLHLQPLQVCLLQGFLPLHLQPEHPSVVHLHRNRVLGCPLMRPELQHLRPHAMCHPSSFRTPTRDRTEDPLVKSQLLCR